MALTTYIELLATIHRIVLTKKKNEFIVPTIMELFPCTTDPASRLDKRDIWELPMSLLGQAVEEWSRGFSGFKKGTWTTALTRVRRTADGIAEVDDFLWVIMQVWAKAIVNRTQKCEQKGKSYAVKEGVVSKRASSGINPESTGVLDELAFPHCGGVITLTNLLNSIDASTNNPDESSTGHNNSTDLLKCSSMYAQTISRSARCNYSILEKFLKSCVLWDVSSCPKRYSDTQVPDFSSDLQRNGRVSLLCDVSEPASATLSLRYAQYWWSANKEGIMNEIEVLRVCIHFHNLPSCEISSI